MLRDVFYYGSKPNVHPKEKFATSLEDARQQCTTEHFWIINEYCDYRGFDWDWDFEFLPDEDVWAEEHNNVWPSQHQKDSGTWLCASRFSDVIIYRADVNPIKRKNIKNSNWVKLDLIDETKFDFSWHPDPTDPPYIYTWGCKYFPVELQACLEYHVLDASTVKYMTDTVELLPQLDRWVTPSNIDDTNFDYSWRPDPLEPALIWQFSSQWQKTGGPSYVMPNATEVKYITFQKVKVLANKSKWTIPDNIDSSNFDFSWHPDDTSPPYIYRFPTQWAMSGGPTYTVEGATEIKYVDVLTAKAIVDKTNWIVPSTIDSDSFDFSWHPYVEDEPYIYQFGTQWQTTGGPRYITPGTHANSPVKYIDTRIIKAKRLAVKETFNILDNYVIDNFDYSWHPNETEEPFIYVFGNNLYPAEIMPTIEYIVEGATQIKYVSDIVVTLGPDKNNWKIIQPINEDTFDFSWKPNPKDPPYIYIWGNKFISNKYKSTIEYHVEGATEIKYMENLVEVTPEWDKWVEVQVVDKTKFDFTWRPDPREPGYIYVWGNKYIDGELIPTVEYHCENATEIKYMSNDVCVLPELDRWVIPANIDDSSFDYTWRPDPREPNLIWQFGTQWQKTSGPRYIFPDATEIKYIDTHKVKMLASNKGWIIPDNIDTTSFDFSWHPDDTSPPYIYRFPTQWAMSGGPVYAMEGATEVKYIDVMIAKAMPNRANWEFDPTVIDANTFDFSWHPYVEDEPYIYQFGTQWQKTGGPKYITPDTHANSPVKYIDTRIIKSKRLEVKKAFTVLDDNVVVDFDYSWHPDTTEEPFIYVFGNNQYPAEIMPTIEYVVDGATQVKYINEIVAKLGENKSAWMVPDNIDTTDFDFSWVPNPKDPAYIYEYGTQWQKTGGPRYIVQGATEVKYIDTHKVKMLASNKGWIIPDNIDTTSFDFSWHPDDTSPPYIYQFGTQWAMSGGPIYTVPGATEVKYIDKLVSKALPNKNNWEILSDIDSESFDFSWHPYVEDEPYIYQFGTQWQKTGGPKYITPGTPANSPVKYIDTRIIKSKRLPNEKVFNILNNNVVVDFDYSWHPDSTEEPYIYVFGNNQYPAEIMPTVEYIVKGATQVKYINDIVAKLGENKSAWIIPDNIDVTGFDFSWVPNPKDPAYIYEYGTQWQKTGGPRYVVQGATETKYIDTKNVKKLVDTTSWTIPDYIDTNGFDYSWHPDDTSPPYIYRFPTQWAMSGGPIYTVPGATEVKYIDVMIAKAMPNKDNWEYDPSIIDIASFDFSWHPYVEDEPYIYQFGTQWQKTGGPKYITPGTPANSPVKYIDTRIIKSKRLPNEKVFNILNNNVVVDFDYSWHPDDTDEPYIYHFGNSQYPAEIMPTIEYVVEGATQVKYINDIVAKLGENKSNWTIPENVDVTNFDFSWVPNPKDPAYIYEYGTQWQKTGGPRYIVPNATEVKYVDIQKVKILPSEKNWTIPNNVDIAEFDFSWHPDDTSPPYIYQFGTQWAMSGGPKYIVDNATEIKYIDVMIAKATPNKDNWEYNLAIIDIESFDFSWHPYAEDEPYIYQFGTQHQKTGGPRYITPGSHANSPMKYIDTCIIKSKRLPNKTKEFVVVDKLVVVDFDYSWHPDETEEPYIYIFGNNQYPAEIMPTIEYIVEGATEVKYINDIVAVLGANKTKWDIPKHIDTTDFNFSWVPNPKDPDYIYEFGTQWQKTGGPRYIVNDATEVKYVEGSKAKTTFIDMSYWTIPENISFDKFDFTWHPDATSPPYIYNFATQWALSGGPIYSVPNALEHKYIDDEIAIALPNKANWVFNDNEIDSESFDFSWHPNIEDQPYVYQFGTQHQKTGGPKYITPGAHKNSPVKYIDTRIIKSKRLPNKQNWIVPDDIDIRSFDFSWHTDDTEAEPYIYVFGTQHQKTSGPQYVTPGIPRLASGKPIGQIKYVDVIKAKKLPNKKHWTNPNNSDVKTFDFSWHPDDTSPPTTYQFGTLVDREDGPKYTHPDTLDDVVVFMERIEKTTENDIQNIVVPRYEIETTLSDLVKQHPNEIFWAMHKNIDYETFNFDWRPEIVNIQWENEYVYVFGSPDSEITQTYFVNANMYLKGNTDFKFIQTEVLTEKYLSTLFKKSDMFFVDRSNSESHARFEKLKQKFPNIQKTRYLNSWVDTINRCINRSTTELCWILNSELDYTDFDFEYYPNPWQMKMVHVFGTQWSHWGTTFMVNRETFAQDTKYIKIIEHLSNLNFVKDRKAKATNILYDIVYIDHGNVDTSTLAGNTVIKYQNSYITTFQKLLAILPVKKEHYVWIASTVCDYKEFDFTYICDPFAKEQLHVFPSDRQKFGDTFLVDVNKLRSLIEDMNVLEDYEKINYNQSQRAKRLPAPIIITENDTHVSTIDSDFDFPYAVFTTSDNKDINIVDTEPMSLWSPESKNIQITSVGGTRIVVPKEAKEYVKRELYDYPYIITNSKLAKSSPMDIVFLSNGETGAEDNYQHLLKVTKELPNRVARVDGVNGRVQAYHAAAEASNTPWMFTVFAKLKVSNKFDWNWQPDRLQLPKHYVFHASNPVNGLKYGHMAMIAYNKKLTLANKGKGLDFTMDDEHEVVELNSGVANFNTDAWSTWRTAFREALKLRSTDDEVSKNRLEFWLTVSSGKFSQYSINGATDAVQYYEEVNGDFEKLKLSYDWPWLYAYFQAKYNDESR